MRCVLFGPCLVSFFSFVLRFGIYRRCSHQSSPIPFTSLFATTGNLLTDLRATLSHNMSKVRYQRIGKKKKGKKLRTACLRKNIGQMIGHIKFHQSSCPMQVHLSPSFTQMHACIGFIASTSSVWGWIALHQLLLCCRGRRVDVYA